MLKLAATTAGLLTILWSADAYAQALNVEPVPTADIDPYDLVQSSSERLESKSSIQMGWFVTYDDISAEGEEETKTWGGESILSRGRGFYSISERGDSVKEYFYDGDTFTARDLTDNFKASVPVSGDFDSLVKTLQDNHGLTLPVWEMMSANLSDDLLKDVTGARNLGLTRIMGQWAYHLSFTEPEQEWEMWISTENEDYLPLMIAGRHKDESQTQYQAMFYNWNFKPQRKKSTFKPKKRKDEETIPFATLRATQTAGGDFTVDEDTSTADK